MIKNVNGHAVTTAAGAHNLDVVRAPNTTIISAKQPQPANKWVPQNAQTYGQNTTNPQKTASNVGSVQKGAFIGAGSSNVNQSGNRGVKLK